MAACTDDPVAACGAGQLCAVMGSGELGFDGDGRFALDTRLASPTSVGVTPQGRIAVVDYSNMRIRVLADDGRVHTVVGNGIHAYSQIGVDRLETPLENPVDAVWAGDELYVLPQHEGRVIRFDDDEVVEPCVGTGVLDDTGDGGDALDATMGYGAGLARAADGTLFISDNTFSRVRRVAVDQTIDTVLGTGEGGRDAPGRGPRTRIRAPERLVVDDDRARLIVADTGNHRVLSVDLDTLQTTLLAGTGDPGMSGDGGPADQAQLFSPVGVQVTTDGAVLVADLENHVLRRVDPDGTIDTVAGDPDGGEPVDFADPLAFPMLRPAGMAWMPDGDLLIAERSGHRVLRWRGAADAL